MNSNEEDLVFETLLEYLKQARSFDFTGYKRTTLKRRIRKQMQARGVETFSDYFDYLQVHPNEFPALFNTILINVTSFFRDMNAWNYLKNDILPELMQQKSTTQQVRVWSAGCASGEEAYTIAVVLAEEMGVENFRQRVKIYATDVDEEALEQARHARYSAQSLESVPQELRERYFERMAENQYLFSQELRRAVIFGRHDLLKDAPIPRLDLLVCRNALMYFNAEAQALILNRFHFALRNTGVLFLGKAEMLLTHANLFTPINLQQRVFRKTVGGSNRERNLAPFRLNADEPVSRMTRYQRLREQVFDKVPHAQLIVDTQGILVLVNAPAQSTFNIALRDLGRPLQDLVISYSPLELRPLIDNVISARRSVSVTDVPHVQPEENVQYFDVELLPLQDGSELLGISLNFIDVTRYHNLQDELQKANQELETVNEELQSSNEELETTNEELQSTNEELETTNEELQSTNEELETMNEELQSTNEELQTINDELRQRTIELNQANAYLSSILTSLCSGVIVVDRQFNILSWNNESENLWGLRADEVQGQSLLGLDIGLPVERLGEPIRNCIRGEERYEMTLAAINRRGQAIQCRISFAPLADQRDILGAILLIRDMSQDDD